MPARCLQATALARASSLRPAPQHGGGALCRRRSLIGCCVRVPRCCCAVGGRLRLRALGGEPAGNLRWELLEVGGGRAATRSELGQRQGAKLRAVLSLSLSSALRDLQYHGLHPTAAPRQRGAAATQPGVVPILQLGKQACRAEAELESRRSGRPPAWKKGAASLPGARFLKSVDPVDAWMDGTKAEHSCITSLLTLTITLHPGTCCCFHSSDETLEAQRGDLPCPVTQQANGRATMLVSGCLAHTPAFCGHHRLYCPITMGPWSSSCPLALGKLTLRRSQAPRWRECCSQCA
ncbi:uncharacterized protein LOC141580517 [Saimiri boliviensis]|uniref:uncharacterized protein LOC141580517 n=1 Tax=Saimiri boliviensis TaxID=27679 RepID=UPI003D7763C7